jgi:hypothetical protein
MNKFKHGMKVTCKINGKEIKDAKVSIDSDGDMYICQNVILGKGTRDHLGYTFAWLYREDGVVTDLKPVKDILDIETYEVGDKLVFERDDIRTVLGICGRLVFLSMSNLPHRFYNCYTIEEIKSYEGVAFKDQPKEDDIVELTMDDIAELKGVPVSRIKIKK